MSRRPVAGALILSAVVFSLLSCDREPEPPPPGSRSPTIENASGEGLDAIEVGEGRRVVVLSHGANGTKEDFYELASGFSEAGWRAIAYDASGTSEQDREEDLRAVVDHARDTGARAVVLAGGSLGASLCLAMAEQLHADAVVSLSAPSQSFGALQAAAGLRGTTPTFVAAAEDNEPFSEEARAIAEAAGVTPVIVTGNGHGTGMLSDHPDMIDTIVSFADGSVAATGGGGG